MINNISWQGYWVTLALISAGYYLIIYLLYYRHDFKVWFRQRPYNSDGIVSASESIIQPPVEKDAEPLIDSCMDELNAFFEESRRKKVMKEELIYSLQLLLKKYPSLKDSEYKESLSNLIATQCEDTCLVRLNEDEVYHVWLG
jgi:hypothetical protein